MIPYTRQLLLHPNSYTPSKPIFRSQLVRGFLYLFFNYGPEFDLRNHKSSTLFHRRIDTSELSIDSVVVSNSSRCLASTAKSIFPGYSSIYVGAKCALNVIASSTRKTSGDELERFKSVHRSERSWTPAGNALTVPTP